MRCLECRIFARLARPPAGRDSDEPTPEEEFTLGQEEEALRAYLWRGLWDVREKEDRGGRGRSLDGILTLRGRRGPSPALPDVEKAVVAARRWLEHLRRAGLQDARERAEHLAEVGGFDEEERRTLELAHEAVERLPTSTGLTTVAAAIQVLARCRERSARGVAEARRVARRRQERDESRGEPTSDYATSPAKPGGPTIVLDSERLREEYPEAYERLLERTAPEVGPPPPPPRGPLTDEEARRLDAQVDEEGRAVWRREISE